VWFILETA